jgi:hypothetical protein
MNQEEIRRGRNELPCIMDGDDVRRTRQEENKQEEVV